MLRSLVSFSVLLGTTGICAATTLTSVETSLTVNGGNAFNGLVPSGGYFDFTDTATGELVSWSVDPVLISADGTVSVLSNGILGSTSEIGGAAVSSGSVGDVTVDAATTLDGRLATTTLSFATTGSLDGSTLLFYAENDIFSFGDDTAAFAGSIAEGDLRLFMFDTLAVLGDAPGLTVQLDGVGGSGASLSSFGSGIWTGFGETLEGGDLSVLSSDGSNFVTGPGDLGVVLGFDLFGDAAEVTVNYRTLGDLPDEIINPTPVPLPASLPLLAVGMASLGWLSRRRRG
ncbi:MAG: hypothetical protein WA957_06210 [Alteraurantiacibacter sp.]